MKTPVLAVLALVALGTLVAAMKTPDRRVVWNPDSAELSWTSSIDGKTKYVINYRTRLMTRDGKQPQRFSEEEAFVWMRNFMGVEAYAIQSEDWHVNPEAFEERHRRVAPPSAPVNRASLNGMVPGR
jgi:hypothetical protein